MLIGNYVAGWWGDKIKLDPTKEGWLAAAAGFLADASDVCRGRSRSVLPAVPRQLARR